MILKIKVKIMMKLKQMKSGGIYLLKGKASANSLFFENKKDMALFRSTANRYLSKYFKIMEYNLKPDGWQLVIRVRDERTIKTHYNIFRKKSKSKKAGLTTLWRILSEMVRVWQSLYVRIFNKRKGRSGGLVGVSYERYVFQSSEEATKYIEKMRSSDLPKEQNNRAYYPNIRQFDIDRSIKRFKWNISSEMFQKGLVSKQKICINCLTKWNLDSHVVHDKFTASAKLHMTKN